jgi:hypothetical protein
VVEDDVVGVDEPDPDDDASDPELAAPAAPEATGTAKPVRVHDPARDAEFNKSLFPGLRFAAFTNADTAGSPETGGGVRGSGSNSASTQPGGAGDGTSRGGGRPASTGKGSRPSKPEVTAETEAPQGPSVSAIPDPDFSFASVTLDQLCDAVLDEVREATGVRLSVTRHDQRKFGRQPPTYLPSAGPNKGRMTMCCVTRLLCFPAPKPLKFESQHRAFTIPALWLVGSFPFAPQQVSLYKCSDWTRALCVVYSAVEEETSTPAKRRLIASPTRRPSQSQLRRAREGVTRSVSSRMGVWCAQTACVTGTGTACLCVTVRVMPYALADQGSPMPLQCPGQHGSPLGVPSATQWWGLTKRASHREAENG